MSSLVVTGGKSLSGEISVSGSKNAALPLIFSSIAINGVSTLSEVPDISDVRISLEILKCFGAEITRCGKTLVIDTRYLKYCEPDTSLVEKLRASTYLLGAMLSRFGKARIYNFGGCNFCKRPIDMHISAIEAFGGTVDGEYVYASSLVGNDIFFDKASVGATINALIMASSAAGVSRIYGFAREPHVLALIKFLRSSGIRIFCKGTCLEIEGGKAFGGKTKVIPDMIEAGTYIVLSLLTDSNLLIKGADPEHLTALLSALSEEGAGFIIDQRGIIPYGKIEKPVKIVTSPYPGFPTYLQPQVAPLLARAFGGTITEGVWQGRFGYLSRLSDFGLEYELSGDTATIFPSKLKSGVSIAPDLRGGAALLISALYTPGKSEIKNAEFIFRGYENIIEKLDSIGAKIERIT